MDEFLAYRFPNEEIQVFQGSWNEVRMENLLSETSHFVVSDADGKKFYQFKANSSALLGDLVLPSHALQNEYEISHDDYLRALNGLVSDMKEQDVKKVVYSRVINIPFKLKQLQSLFQRLEDDYPDALIYLFYSKELGIWMGATPETLIAKNIDSYTTMSLAGTLPSDSSKNWTNKEYQEQAYVTDYIATKLALYSSQTLRSAVYDKYAGPVKHLCTDFTFTIQPNEVVDLIRDLHPTPAVCGIPLCDSRTLYKKWERHERKLYTGMIGLLGKEKLNLFVNLRCMQCFNNSVDLFVGGGITVDSDYESEWNETIRKSATLRKHILNE